MRLESDNDRDRDVIQPMVKEGHLDKVDIIHADYSRAAVIAVQSVRTDGRRPMKGLINTSDFLKAILTKKTDLDRCLLSHLAIMEIPGEPSLLHGQRFQRRTNLEQKTDTEKRA